MFCDCIIVQAFDQLRKTLRDTLQVPDVDSFLKTPGVVQFPEMQKWADLATKLNMLVASATQDFQGAYSEDILKVRHKQHAIGKVLMKAILRTLITKENDHAINAVLSGSKLSKDQWSGHMDVLTKLANMTTLKSVFAFDYAQVLGTSETKVFDLKVLTRISRLFGLCLKMAEWLKLDLVLHFFG